MNFLDEYINKKGLCIILSGPSGCGKDTVLDLLKLEYHINKCVTATTRAPREGEVDGVDYNFYSKEEFLKKIEMGVFLEYAQFSDNYYGTPKENVQKYINAGKNVLLKIEVQGAINVKKIMPESVMIFLVPPSIEKLEERLRLRNTETEEHIKKRIEIAKSEIKYIPYYDYIVVNDDLSKAVDDVRSILIAESKKIAK